VKLITALLITYADGSRWVGILPSFVYVSVRFHTTSQKSMQLGSPSLTYKYSTISPGKHFISGSKVKGQGHESTKNIAGVGLCTLVSVGCF